MGEITLKEQDAHETPPSGYDKLYVKTDGKWYYKDDTGDEHEFGEGVPTAHAATHKGGGSDVIDAATGSVDGLMSSADKTKIDTVDTNADVTGSNAPQAHAASHNAGGGDALAIDAAAGTGSLRTLGTASTAACAGNDSRLSDARTPTSHASSHQSGGGDAIKLDDLSAPDDNTDLDSTTSTHGLLPKLGGGSTNFLRADGTWAAPPGGGDDEKVAVDSGATAGYLGAASSDGVLRTGSQISYTDGGDYVTLDVNESNIKLDDLGTPDDNTDLNATTSLHGLLPKLGGGTSNFLRADGSWAAPPGGGGFPEKSFDRIRGENWAPSWAQLETAGDAVYLNSGLTSDNFVGNATAAYIDAISSPADQEAYVATTSGTVGFTSVVPGDVVVYDYGFWSVKASASGGYVRSGTRLQLSTTIALISPYTDGTDDGKIMAFDGTSNTGSEAQATVTFTLPVPSTLDDGIFKGPLLVHSTGANTDKTIVKVTNVIYMADGLLQIELVGTSSILLAASSNGWTRLSKLQNLLQVRRAASWNATNFSSAAAIPFDTVDYAGNEYIGKWVSGTATRINLYRGGKHKISTTVQIASTTSGYTYSLDCWLALTGTEISNTRVTVSNWETEQMNIVIPELVVDLPYLGGYIELFLDHTNMTGSVTNVRITVETIY